MRAGPAKGVAVTDCAAAAASGLAAALADWVAAATDCVAAAASGLAAVPAVFFLAAPAVLFRAVLTPHPTARSRP
jgi:hypothetical protein